MPGLAQIELPSRKLDSSLLKRVTHPQHFFTVRSAECNRRIHSTITVYILRGVMVQSQQKSIVRRVRDLTDLERQIVTLVCNGYPNKIIARKLQVGEGTIKTHLHAIYLKLGIKNRTSLIDSFGKAQGD
jgi:DNA-binding NarL/FixJ family response regulator